MNKLKVYKKTKDQRVILEFTRLRKLKREMNYFIKKYLIEHKVEEKVTEWTLTKKIKNMKMYYNQNMQKNISCQLKK